MKKVLNDIKGIDIIIEKYLKVNNIFYEAYTINDQINNHLEFEDICMLVHDDSVLFDCQVMDIVCKDDACLKQVKEYLHRCNHENGLVWFDLHQINQQKLNITCGFSKLFTESNIEIVLIEGIKEIKNFKCMYAYGIKEVARGR